jgi:hypothetical protein
VFLTPMTNISFLMRSEIFDYINNSSVIYSRPQAKSSARLRYNLTLPDMQWTSSQVRRFLIRNVVILKVVRLHILPVRNRRTSKAVTKGGGLKENVATVVWDNRRQIIHKLNPAWQWKWPYKIYPLLHTFIVILYFAWGKHSFASHTGRKGSIQSKKMVRDMNYF